MKIDTKNLISITEANQNFSKVVKMVEEKGDIIILKNNKPKYQVKRFCEDDIVLTNEEKLEVIARRILKEHRLAFVELGK